MSRSENEPRRWSPPSPPGTIDVFIACARADLNTADQLRNELSPLAAWIPERDLVPGDVRDAMVNQALESSSLVVVIVPSEPPVEWNHCEEVQQALALAQSSTGLRRVIPVYLKGEQPPKRVLYGLRRIVGLYLAKEGSWAGVAERIRHIVNRSRSQPTEVTDDAPSLTTRLREIEAKRRELAAAHDTDPQLDAERRSIKRELRAGGRLNPGDILGGRYRLSAWIGRGGFGQVWRAYDEVHRLDVAIKVLHAHHAGEPDGRRRFERGVRAMAQIDHPNVVRVRQGVTEDDGLVFFVMSHLPGGDLAAAIKDGRIAPHDVLTLVPPLADALAVAHQRGILHRDVKPANILLDAAGRPCLTDFDLARAADSEAMTSGPLGTWGYAAPECRTDASSAKPTADVFGLAMTAMSILLQRPMGEDDPLHVERVLANSTDPLVRALAPVLEPALRVHPDDRTPSMERLLAAMQTIDMTPQQAMDTAPSSTGIGWASRASQTRQEPHRPSANGQAAEEQVSPEEAGGSLLLLGIIAAIIWFAWKKWG